MKSDKKRTAKAKMEFSKKILVIAGALNIAVVIFTCVMVWRTLDTSPLIYLIPSVAAEVATGTGYYYWKARAENQIKLEHMYGRVPDVVPDDTMPVG